MIEQNHFIDHIINYLFIAKYHFITFFFNFVVKGYLCSLLGRVEIPTFIFFFFFLSTIVSCFHSQQQWLKCICLLGQLESLHSKESPLFNGNPQERCPDYEFYSMYKCKPFTPRGSTIKFLISFHNDKQIVPRIFSLLHV